MSPSIRPTRCPAWASAAATFAATVDLPTPPLPLDTAMARPRCGIATGVGGGGTAPGAGRDVAAARAPPGSTTLMRTAVTPTTAWAALRASRAREAGSSRGSWNGEVTAPARADGGGTPAFARQTGLACSACHTHYPELTATGRAFKLNGYVYRRSDSLQATSSGGQQNLLLNLVPPISIMLQTSFTSTQ